MQELQSKYHVTRLATYKNEDELSDDDEDDDASEEL